MLLMVVVPAAIALHSVRVSAAPHDFSSNPTPFGYTWSLLLFIVPIVVIAGWFLPHEGVEIPRKAFLLTLAILVPAARDWTFSSPIGFSVFPTPPRRWESPRRRWAGRCPLKSMAFT